MQDGTIFQTATQWRLPFHRWWSIGCNCHGPGFNVETVEYKNISFTVWDLGGQDKVLAWCLSIWCILYEKCLVLFSYTFFIHFRTRYMQIHYWICRTTCGFHIFNGGIQKNKKKMCKRITPNTSHTRYNHIDEQNPIFYYEQNSSLLMKTNNGFVIMFYEI